MTEHLAYQAAQRALVVNRKFDHSHEEYASTSSSYEIIGAKLEFHPVTGIARMAGFKVLAILMRKLLKSVKLTEV